MRKDDVVFVSQGTFPSSSTTVVALKGGVVDELIPWITDLTDPSHIQATVASVSSASTQSGSRVQFDVWDEYAHLRYEGGTGGPEIVAPLTGSVAGDNLAIAMYGQTIIIDSLPPSLRGSNRKLLMVIDAVSQEYLVLAARDETPPEKLGDSEQMFVHDRLRDRWSTIQIEGNWSQSRVFGLWLGTIVRMARIDQRLSPGRSNERNSETDRLPNVQEEYATWAGRFYWLPGALVLQNLADGRKIRIETGQENSEILNVRGDTALYRVNDTIYQAQIAGSQLQNTSVIVKDEDVPEVHWVFWSNR